MDRIPERVTEALLDYEASAERLGELRQQEATARESERPAVISGHGMSRKSRGRPALGGAS
jgi:hypothetical protein